MVHRRVQVFHIERDLDILDRATGLKRAPGLHGHGRIAEVHPLCGGQDVEHPPIQWFEFEGARPFLRLQVPFHSQVGLGKRFFTRENPQLSSAGLDHVLGSQHDPGRQRHPVGTQVYLLNLTLDLRDVERTREIFEFLPGCLDGHFAIEAGRKVLHFLGRVRPRSRHRHPGVQACVGGQFRRFRKSETGTRDRHLFDPIQIRLLLSRLQLHQN